VTPVSGDKVGVKAHGHSVMRTVVTATDTHVTVIVAGSITEVPISELTACVHTGVKAPTLERPRRQQNRDSAGRWNGRFTRL